MVHYLYWFRPNVTSIVLFCCHKKSVTRIFVSILSLRTIGFRGFSCHCQAELLGSSFIHSDSITCIFCKKSNLVVHIWALGHIKKTLILHCRHMMMLSNWVNMYITILLTNIIRTAHISFNAYVSRSMFISNNTTFICLSFTCSTILQIRVNRGIKNVCKNVNSYGTRGVVLQDQALSNMIKWFRPRFDDKIGGESCLEPTSRGMETTFMYYISYIGWPEEMAGNILSCKF